MFCANCGSPVPDGSQFCPKCGGRQPVATSPAAAPSPGAAPAANPPQPKKSRKKTILMVCVAVGIAALVIFRLVYLLTGGGSSKNAGGYDTPEEVAKTFAQSSVGDEELFKSCIHPSMLDEVMPYYYDADSEIKITELYVKGTYDFNDFMQADSKDDKDFDYFADLQEDMLEDYGVKVTKAAVVKLFINCYDYSESEEYGIARDVLTIYVDGAWYAWGLPY